HEALVPRHIDEDEHRAVWQRVKSITEVDGDAALFFFLQAIGVDAGERLDERRLAVVDMASGADQHDASPFRVEPELRQLSDELALILQAAQIELERAVGNSPDHRDGKRAERGRQLSEGGGLAAPALERRERERRTR